MASTQVSRFDFLTFATSRPHVALRRLVGSCTERLVPCAHTRPKGDVSQRLFRARAHKIQLPTKPSCGCYWMRAPARLLASSPHLSQIFGLVKPNLVSPLWHKLSILDFCQDQPFALTWRSSPAAAGICLFLQYKVYMSDQGNASSIRMHRCLLLFCT